MEKVIDRFIKGDKGMACVEYNDSLGNPTIFSGKYIHELLSLNDDIGGKSIIKKHLDDLEKVSMHNEVEMMDIDTREEFSEFKYSQKIFED